MDAERIADEEALLTPSEGRPRTRALALCIALALTGIGAAPTITPAAFCLPLLMKCGSPSPSPTPSPTLSVPGLPGLPGVPAPAPSSPTSPAAPGATPAPAVPASPDAGAPTFTQPPAQLGGSSISFSGLQSASVVDVPLADGSKTPVLKLVADDIVITDFTLSVRKSTGPILLSTATRMELKGHVQVYVDSVTATLLGGKPFTLGAATPPPADGLPPQLLKVNLGLVGVTADSIAFKASHQNLH
ncbi:MAG: hypothetical protein ACHP7F_05375 [Actinomycetales bacterium]